MKRIWLLITLLVCTVFIRFILLHFLETNFPFVIRIIVSIMILGIGAFFVLKKSADLIEETTEVLSERTKLASGLLQSIGTAFPDMVLGIIAAVISLQARSTDLASSISYAIIAASTTFGSNIYNMGHAAWCVYRQNLANTLNHDVKMFPFLASAGILRPIHTHANIPSPEETSTVLQLIHHLSLLTAVVALCMIIFGKTGNLNVNMGEIYQLTQPVGLIIFIVSVFIMFRFRKTKRPVNQESEMKIAENYFRKKTMLIIFICLVIAGISILFTAESMIYAIQVISELFKIPVFIVGTLSGIVGCLGEMIVVHDYSVHSNGRLGDALIGVVMDNIVTIMGAAIVAMIGGIFLGGRDLLFLFVLILLVNTTLLWQVSILQVQLIYKHIPHIKTLHNTNLT
jgi:hypothetical protein